MMSVAVEKYEKRLIYIDIDILPLTAIVLAKQDACLVSRPPAVQAVLNPYPGLVI